jgi:hypothetical protein
MSSRNPAVALTPPVGWTPQAAIAARVPEIAGQAREADREIKA